MKSVKLIISETGICDFVKMRELPSTGEFINTQYFQKRYREFEDVTSFCVSRIIHFYDDKMSDSDYTEIVLVPVR